jgi:hypothetical protein
MKDEKNQTSGWTVPLIIIVSAILFLIILKFLIG